jgi:uncharacterized DUF497 family protein
MRELSFVWDESKNRENQKRHGVSFEEARSVFFDEEAREFFDPDHSDDEDRFLLVGRSYKLRVLLVCHCFREAEGTIRIISARRATRKERFEYRGGKR